MSEMNIKDKIVNLDIEIIDRMVREGIVIPIMDEVINKYVEIDDIGLYRLYVENLNENNSYFKEVVEDRRNKIYDYIFNSVTEDGLIEEYKSIYDDIVSGREIKSNNINLVMGLCGSHDDIYSFLYDESSCRLHEILVDKYFKDDFHNFIINLEMVLKFIDSTDDFLIDNERLMLYKKIYNFDSLSVIEKINLYNSMNSGVNYVDIFYDDYRKCKEYAYSMYNKKVLKTENMVKSELSSAYGVDVYELDGDDFMAIVHQTKIDRTSDNSAVWKEFNRDEKVTVSFSMIDQDRFDVIYGNNSFVVLGFSNLDIDRIIHVYHSDSFTSGIRGSDRVNEILTIDNLMNGTKGYNELFYLENNLAIKYGNRNHNELKPSYVMCYDYITDLEVNIAKRYGIPIVLFHTNKYENKVDPTIDYNNDVYFESYNKKKK